MFSPPEPLCSISLNQCLNLTGGFLRRVLRVRREQRSEDCPFCFTSFHSPDKSVSVLIFLSALATARPDSVNDMTLIRLCPPIESDGEPDGAGGQGAVS